VVGPWEVLLVVTVWTVSYFCLYFQAAVFLSNVASELVTEVCLYSVSLITRYADYMFFFLRFVFRSSTVCTVFLAATSLSSRKWRDIEVNLRSLHVKRRWFFFDFNRT